MTQSSHYNPTEQDEVLAMFTVMLRDATTDGGTKRAAGLKPPWWEDPGHAAAMYRHIFRWDDGERKDKDSGAHPLIHAAWRALAIAYQDTYGTVPPSKRNDDG